MLELNNRSEVISIDWKDLHAGMFRLRLDRASANLGVVLFASQRPRQVIAELHRSVTEEIADDPVKVTFSVFSIDGGTEGIVELSRHYFDMEIVQDSAQDCYYLRGELRKKEDLIILRDDQPARFEAKIEFGQLAFWMGVIAGVLSQGHLR